jgi:hypothetical protein
VRWLDQIQPSAKRWTAGKRGRAADGGTPAGALVDAMAGCYKSRGLGRERCASSSFHRKASAMTDDPVRSCDILIREATIVDGTGAAAFAGDVAISGERIAAVGRLGSVTGALEVEAAGRTLAPGFIDVHTHDDNALLVDATMAAKVTQGVTTVVTGNCGVSLAPLVLDRPPPPPLDLLGGADGYRFASFAAYTAALDAAPAAVNAALMVGHSTLRVGTLRDLGRAANDKEIEAMRSCSIPRAGPHRPRRCWPWSNAWPVPARCTPPTCATRPTRSRTRWRRASRRRAGPACRW